MSKKNLCFFSTPILLAFFLFFNLEKASASLNNDDEDSSQVDSLIAHYKSTLPAISDERSPESIVAFLQFFSQKKDAEGADKLVEKTRQLMETNEPLSFVLPGFPFKSFNEKKVISPGEIDLGDVLALTILDHLCQKIERVYEAGACVTVVPDAIRISCFLEVQTQREDYISNLRRLLPSDRIRVKEIHEFESKPTTGKSLEEVAFFLSKRGGCGVCDGSGTSFVKHELEGTFYIERKKENALALMRAQRTFRDHFPEELKAAVKDLSYDEFLLYLANAIKKDNENQGTYKKLKNALEGKINDHHL
ncbi:MAG TPA: hypothetical protein DD412_06125, partial [Holosporales bacterium]|nr:hypothetical protein [Holosporales bacterium]